MGIEIKKPGWLKYSKYIQNITFVICIMLLIGIGIYSMSVPYPRKIMLCVFILTQIFGLGGTVLLEIKNKGKGNGLLGAFFRILYIAGYAMMPLG